jgi:signal transduction histidine kinase
MGGLAVQFAQRHREELFPSAPLLLASVDHRLVRSDSLSNNETAVTVQHDLPRTIESIRRVLPDTQQVVVVLGASAHEAYWVQESGNAFRTFEPQLTFTWTNHWTYEELLDHCAHLPPHTVILFGLFLLDANGVPHSEAQTLDALHATANAPIFGLHSPQLGHGIVGGPLMSYEDVGRQTSAVALRLLNGEPAHAIPAMTLSYGAPVFDARELRRWSIAESRLQAGSIIRFREPEVSRPWANTAVAGVTISVLMGLAAMLAAPRNGVPDGSVARADNGSGAALSRLSQRLLQAQEAERASLARWIEDDVCQKLASLSMDLHARGEDELRDHVSNLVRESLNLSDPIYAKLSFLGLLVTARGFAEQRCAQHGVALEFTAWDVPDHLQPNLSIALFRVFEQAVDNALRHSKTRELAVSFRRAGELLVLDVDDSGIGFDSSTVASAEALGLVAMRERLQPLGGACVIESRPGGGTRVRAFARLDANRTT